MSNPVAVAATPRRAGQRGMSFFGVMAIIGLVIFFAVIGFTLAPSYLDFLQVRSAMDALEEKPEVVAKGKGAIRKSLTNTLYMNNVRSIDTSQLKVAQERDAYRVSIDYDVRKHLFGNVDAVMHFAHSVSLERQ